MMNQSNTIQAILILAAMVLGTVITRFLPFFIFPPGKPTPKVVDFLGKSLPYATMTLLVVYCLRNISFLTGSHGLPELLAILLIVVLHRWKGNSLLSIGAGTACYMILVQMVFG